ncbi:hypothetical protein BAY59_31240 [Prauserella coralliicola]|nr:hypothetical protein BAY59_31240 [Prauserella coralliicola]
MAVIVDATFDTDLEAHAAWYGCQIARDTGDAYSPPASLLATTTEAFGSAVMRMETPAVVTAPGTNYTFRVRYREAVATMPAVAWRVRWIDAGNALIREDTIDMPRSAEWAEASGTLTAPETAARVEWRFTWSVSAAGPAFRIDNILVASVDAPAGARAYRWNGTAWVPLADPLRWDGMGWQPTAPVEVIA